MGGEGPYVQFSSTRSTSWADRTGLAQLSDEELEAAYSRAGDFLKDRKKELTDEHGWSAQPEDDDTLFLIVTTRTHYQRSYDVKLRLPSKFASFLDHANNDMWSRMFHVFEARRLHRNSGTLHIDGPTPLSDIFYLLQVLCPGMLLIIRVDDIDERGEMETTRALPSKEWVKDHTTMLQHVLGSEQRYESLLAAVTDRSKSFKDDWITRYDSSYDDLHYTNRWGVREPLDYTACGSECGYCGQCDY